jgi:hypothetical protein
MKKTLVTTLLCCAMVAAWIIDGPLFQLVAVFICRVVITSVCASFLFMYVMYKPDDDSLTNNTYGVSDKHIGGDGLY